VLNQWMSQNREVGEVGVGMRGSYVPRGCCTIRPEVSWDPVPKPEHSCGSETSSQRRPPRARGRTRVLGIAQGLGADHQGARRRAAARQGAAAMRKRGEGA
jgi:hypothetical protein